MFRLAVSIPWSVELLHSQTLLSSMHVALMFTVSDLHWGWFRCGSETVGLEYWKLINTGLILETLNLTT